jgi:prolipoprotein diacylglyceryltransferase
LFGIFGARAISIIANFDRFNFNVFSWLSLSSVPGLSMYGAIVGVFFAALLFSHKMKWRFWEVWDGVCEAGLWLALISSIGAFMSSVLPGQITTLPWGVEFLGLSGRRHPITIYIALVCIISLVSMALVRRHYRRFGWYKSGRIGFVGLFGTLASGVGLFVLEFLTDRGIYFMGIKLEKIFVSLISIVSVILIYKLSGRKISEDKSSISKFFRSKVVLVKQKYRASNRG